MNRALRIMAAACVLGGGLSLPTQGGAAARRVPHAARQPPRPADPGTEVMPDDNRVLDGPGPGGYPLGSAASEEIQENRRIRCNSTGLEC